MGVVMGVVVGMAVFALETCSMMMCGNDNVECLFNEPAGSWRAEWWCVGALLFWVVILLYFILEIRFILPLYEASVRLEIYLDPHVFVGTLLQYVDGHV